MPRNILLTGRQSSLADSVGKRLGLADRVWWSLALTELDMNRSACQRVTYGVQEGARLQGDEAAVTNGKRVQAAVTSRQLARPLLSHHEGNEFSDSPSIDSLWFFDWGQENSGRDIEPDTGCSSEDLTALLACGSVKAFNCVAPIWLMPSCALSEDNARLSIGARTSLAYCRSHKIISKVFYCCPVLSRDARATAVDELDFGGFLAVLADLRREISEREPAYFDYHALRCVVNDERELVSVLPVELAAALIVDEANKQCSASSEVCILSESNSTIADLFDRVGDAYGLSMLGTASTSALNDIDELFDERIKCFKASSWLNNKWNIGQQESLGRACIVGQYDAQCQLQAFSHIHKQQREAGKREASIDLDWLSTRRLTDDRGTDLIYHTSRHIKPPVVVVNAFGVDLACWSRLINVLINDLRIITWQPRGLTSDREFEVVDHVGDLKAIVEQESIDQCHLVGWCTGGTIAVEFAAQHPERVASLTLLNSAVASFPVCCVGNSNDYSHNLAEVCRGLLARPAMAPVAMWSLRAGSQERCPHPTEEPNANVLAQKVLASMSLPVRDWIVAPFRDEISTMRYARNILKFLSHDGAVSVAKVKAPCLVIGSEYDKIATPAMMKRTAACLPQSRYVQLRGETHYALFDCAPLLGKIIMDFVRQSRMSTKMPEC